LRDGGVSFPMMSPEAVKLFREGQRGKKQKGGKSSLHAGGTRDDGPLSGIVRRRTVLGGKRKGDVGEQKQRRCERRECRRRSTGRNGKKKKKRPRG